MAARSFYLLAYDLADDRRRAKVAREMEAVGTRVQGSVFEAYLTHQELAEVIRRARRLLDEQEDSLRVYQLCEECKKKIRVYGRGQISEPPTVVIL